MTKQDIRNEIKVLCSENAGELVGKSAAICRNIISSAEYEAAQVVLAYMALKDEVDLDSVILDALKKGKKVAVPKIINFDKGIMQFFYLDEAQKLNTQTEAGTLGINEPDQNMLTPLNINELKDKKTLILVPGRAFTKSGDRLGRGKGFYDRFLAKIVGSSPTMTRLPNVSIAGVCFEFQVLAELPTDPNDIKMNLIFYK